MEPTQAVNTARILNRLRDLPSPPLVIQQILQVVDDPGASARSLSTVISHDPAFTSKVLRLVNSAYYGFNRKIATVNQAVVILGFTTVRGLALSLSLVEMLFKQSQPSLDPGRFWEHCVGTAISARVLARRLRPALSGELFSAGLLHDIGKLVLDRYAAEEYRRALDACHEEGLPLSEAEAAVLGISHCEMGRQVAEKWHLPFVLCDAMRWHHNPEAATRNQEVVALVQVADNLCRTLGIGDSGDSVVSVLPERAVEQYGLSEEAAEHLMREIDQQMVSAEALLNLGAEREVETEETTAEVAEATQTDG